MHVTCNLRLTYPTSTEAEQVFESVHIDDASFMKTKRKKNHIITKIETQSVPSMLHTVDDLLACVGIAEKIIQNNHSKK